jgi:hypothetical protein
MTNCVVSVMSNGKAVQKIVAGCDGYNAEKLANRLLELRAFARLEDIRKVAFECGVGCEECLVVMDGESHAGPEDIGPLYREKFGDPEFNPRWECGLAAHIWIVDIDARTATPAIGGPGRCAADGRP